MVDLPEVDNPLSAIIKGRSILTPDNNLLQMFYQNQTPLYRDLIEMASSLTTVTIASNSYNNPDFHIVNFNSFTQLTELIIGDYCFQEAYVVNIANNPSLKCISVGEHSFTHFHDLEFIQAHSGECDSKLFVLNCPQLEDLSIGAFSFADHEIMALNSWLTLCVSNRSSKIENPHSG